MDGLCVTAARTIRNPAPSWYSIQHRHEALVPFAGSCAGETEEEGIKLVSALKGCADAAATCTSTCAAFIMAWHISIIKLR
jgi:hypothetical protein